MKGRRGEGKKNALENFEAERREGGRGRGGGRREDYVSVMALIFLKGNDKGKVKIMITYAWLPFIYLFIFSPSLLRSFIPSLHNRFGFSFLPGRTRSLGGLLIKLPLHDALKRRLEGELRREGKSDAREFCERGENYCLGRLA